MTTTTQRPLTPTTDATPAVLTIPEGELSGASWVSKFQGSTSLDDLDGDFRTGTTNFVAALRAAGATVSIAATFRPPERAYLMHWSWKLSNGKTKAADIPSHAGVNIKWDHGDDKASVKAATAMVSSYGMSGLKVAPALNSRHTEKKAIDMTISWTKKLTIKNASGTDVEIDTEPRTGMNTKLHEVGKTYGVIKFSGGDKDKPHWSTDGR